MTIQTLFLLNNSRKLRRFNVVLLLSVSLYSMVVCSSQLKIAPYFNRDIKSVLLALITEENTALLASIYTMTDGDVVRALLNAAKRNVHVSVIIGHVYPVHRSESLMGALTNHPNVCLYRYQDKHSLMHLKCLVAQSKQSVLTGSCNWTYNGFHRNEESCLLVEGPSLCTEYSNQHELLKKSVHCKEIKGPIYEAHTSHAGDSHRHRHRPR